MLATDPVNTSVLFGLAKEYEKAGLDQELVATLERYLQLYEDEGNAYGMLARAYERINKIPEAKEAYRRGAEAALAHGHPSMAEEYRLNLSE